MPQKLKRIIRFARDFYLISLTSGCYALQNYTALLVSVITVFNDAIWYRI
jgi:hypothetical protein